MKITYIHQYFNTPLMAGGTRSYEMARRLVNMGHQVNIITTWRDRCAHSSWFTTTEANICVHWLPVPYSNCMSNLDRIKAFSRFAFLSTLKSASIKADIIFATSTPLTVAIPGIFASWRLRVPMVFEVRDMWPELPIAMGALNNPLMRMLAKMLERWAYCNSSAIVALSPGMKAGIQKTGYSPLRIAVIPNCSDNSLFKTKSIMDHSILQARPWLHDRPFIVYAGTFGKINGLFYALRLAHELKLQGSNSAILLVGNGAEYASVFEAASRLGVLNENLFIEKEMPKNDMPALFSSASMSASLFLDIPEMRANSSNKFFDSLAAGKPVFLNYGGWMHDLICESGAGISAWGRELPAVASELHVALNDSQWLDSAGARAKSLARLYFDRDSLALQLSEVLVSAKSGNANRSSSISPGVYPGVC